MKLSKEKRLVVLLGRLTFTQEEEKEVESLVSSLINWTEVFFYAVSNKIVTLVWYNLIRLRIKYNIPKYMKSIVKFTEIGIEEQNKLYLKETETIVNAFKNANITCFPVKGAFFIPNIYKEMHIRYLGDLDFIVKKNDLTMVRDTIKSLGYIQGQYITSQDIILPIDRKTDITWKMKMSHLYPFVKQIHSNYLPAIKCDFRFALNDELDPEPVNEMINCSKDGKLEYYHQFIHLCTHLYEEAKKEAYTSLGKDLNLIKFCDIREFVLKFMKDEDFNKAIEFAQKYNLSKAVYFTLYYLNMIYNDGYEQKNMEKIKIDDEKFLTSYGKTTLEDTGVWKRDFWDRIFSGYNMDAMDK